MGLKGAESMAVQVIPNYATDATRVDASPNAPLIRCMTTTRATLTGCEALNESEILQRHDRLIRKIVSGFAAEHADDLLQVARLALLRAARVWSPDGGGQLWTYARRSVLREMIAYATRECGRPLPALNRWDGVGETDYQSERWDATDTAEYLAKDDAPDQEHVTSLVEVLALVDRLPPTERDVVRAYLDTDSSLDATAVATGLSRAGTHKVLQRAIGLLRELAGVGA